MKAELILLLIIAALLGYIIWLQIQLVKKNNFITTTVKRLSLIEESRSMEEMMSFLEELQKIAAYNSFFKDKFPDENSKNFILENENQNKIFMHYTKDEKDAQNIINNGFLFADSFYRTALPVTGDKLDFRVKHNSRKFFGDYIVIISIANDIVNHYTEEVKKAGISSFSFENMLTEKPPVKNENGDLIFSLPKQFIKGIINHRTGDIIKNPDFNPDYNSPAFEANIKSIKFV